MSRLPGVLLPGSELASKVASKTEKASALHPDEPAARAARKEGASPEPSVEPERVSQGLGPAEATPEALSSLAASPAPSSELRDTEILLRQGDRIYQVRSLAKNLSYDVLEVDLCVTLEPGDGFHVETLDLYAARERSVFVQQAAQGLGLDEKVVKRDLGRVLLDLEDIQDLNDLLDEPIQKALEPRLVAVTPSKAAPKQEDPR